MAKRLTKTQVRRLYLDILSKSRKLWNQDYVISSLASEQLMSTPDLVAIEKIVKKYLKKMR